MDRAISNMTYGDKEIIKSINTFWLRTHKSYARVYDRLCLMANTLREDEQSILQKKAALQKMENPDRDAKSYVLNLQIMHYDDKIQFVRYKLQLKLCFDHYIHRFSDRELELRLLALSDIMDDDRGEIKALNSEKKALTEQSRELRPPASYSCCIC